MLIPEDQADGQEGTESEGADTSAEDTSKDNQETSDDTQSNEGKGEGEDTSSKLYKLPDGREVSADEVLKEYNTLLPEFTRKSQLLKKFEADTKAREAKAEAATQESIDSNEILKNMNPAAKEAIKALVTPLIQENQKVVEEKAAADERDRAFESELKSLEKEFPGGDGKPKFDRKVLMEKMGDPENRIYDPRALFNKLHQKDFNNLLIKEALKKGKGGTDTEDTGRGGGPKKPEGKTPTSFAEAAKSAHSRLTKR